MSTKNHLNQKSQTTLFQNWGYYDNQLNKTGKSAAVFEDDLDEIDEAALLAACDQAEEQQQACHQLTGEQLTNQHGTLQQSTSQASEVLPGFDVSAGTLWIYPTNYPVRDYQFNIVGQALKRNTLVTLPTGLGKTFIAAVVMYNYYRWYPQGKVVFMAPTRALVAQQIEACSNIMGIPQSDMAEMTGSLPPQERKKTWRAKRIFFLTPQVLTNDLGRHACPAVDVKCLVVDEAHKALGNHAYCEVVRELSKYTPNFRVLALSATPGGDLKAVQQVINNLLISHVEIRSEESIDIQPYAHERKVEKVVVPLGEDLKHTQTHYLQLLKGYIQRLSNAGAIFKKDPALLSKFQLLMARDAFRQDPPPQAQNKGAVEGDFAISLTLYHGYELLMQHGTRSLYNFLSSTVDGEKGFSRTRQELMRNGDFVQMMNMLKDKFDYFDEGGNSSSSDTKMNKSPSGPVSCTQRSKKFVVSHPKMQKLQEVVIQHFKNYQQNLDGESSLPDPGCSDTRVMIFSQYRDSVVEIAEMLNCHQPLVRCMSFVGQSSAGKTTKGISQKEQLRVVKEFRCGNYNTLVSTCVGEEGLDIGDVDLIVCYDAHKSPTRLVQRMGRTGRKRSGRIVMLMTEGKEASVYDKSQYSRKGIHRALQGNSKSLQLFPSSPPMIPRGLNPQPHKMYITTEKYAGNRKKKKLDQTDGKVENDAFLNDNEHRYLMTHYKVDEPTPTLSTKGTFLSLGETKEAAEDPQLSLSSWSLWQSKEQKTRLVSHSERCKNFVQLVEFMEVQDQIDGDDIYGMEMALHLNQQDISKPDKGIEKYCKERTLSKTTTECYENIHSEQENVNRPQQTHPVLLISDDSEDEFLDRSGATLPSIDLHGDKDSKAVSTADKIYAVDECEEKCDGDGLQLGHSDGERNLPSTALNPFVNERVTHEAEETISNTAEKPEHICRALDLTEKEKIVDVTTADSLLESAEIVPSRTPAKVNKSEQKKLLEKRTKDSSDNAFEENSNKKSSSPSNTTKTAALTSSRKPLQNSNKSPKHVTDLLKLLKSHKIDSKMRKGDVVVSDNNPKPSDPSPVDAGKGSEDGGISGCTLETEIVDSAIAPDEREDLSCLFPCSQFSFTQKPSLRETGQLPPSPPSLTTLDIPLSPSVASADILDDIDINFGTPRGRLAENISDGMTTGDVKDSIDILGPHQEKQTMQSSEQSTSTVSLKKVANKDQGLLSVHCSADKGDQSNGRQGKTGSSNSGVKVDDLKTDIPNNMNDDQISGDQCSAFTRNEEKTSPSFQWETSKRNALCEDDLEGIGNQNDISDVPDIIDVETPPVKQFQRSQKLSVSGSFLKVGDCFKTSPSSERNGLSSEFPSTDMLSSSHICHNDFLSRRRKNSLTSTLSFHSPAFEESEKGKCVLSAVRNACCIESNIAVNFDLHFDLSTLDDDSNLYSSAYEQEPINTTEVEGESTVPITHKFSSLLKEMPLAQDGALHLSPKAQSTPLVSKGKFPRINGLVTSMSIMPTEPRGTKNNVTDSLDSTTKELGTNEGNALKKKLSFCNFSEVRGKQDLKITTAASPENSFEHRHKNDPQLLKSSVMQEEVKLIDSNTHRKEISTSTETFPELKHSKNKLDTHTTPLCNSREEGERKDVSVDDIKCMQGRTHSLDHGSKKSQVLKHNAGIAGDGNQVTYASERKRSISEIENSPQLVHKRRKSSPRSLSPSKVKEEENIKCFNQNSKKWDGSVPPFECSPTLGNNEKNSSMDHHTNSPNDGDDRIVSRTENSDTTSPQSFSGLRNEKCQPLESLATKEVGHDGVEDANCLDVLNPRNTQRKSGPLESTTNSSRDRELYCVGDDEDVSEGTQEFEVGQSVKIFTGKAVESPIAISEDEILSQIPRAKKRCRNVLRSPDDISPPSEKKTLMRKKCQKKILQSSSDEDEVFAVTRRLPYKKNQPSPSSPLPDSDFLDPSPQKPLTKPIVRKAAKKDVRDKGSAKQKTSRKKAANSFLDEEVELSGSEEMSSDETEGSILDHSLDGFINDASQPSQHSPSGAQDMHAVYMKSIRSPAGDAILHPARNRFKLCHAAANNDSIFSQMPQPDQSYTEDSFCVDAISNPSEFSAGDLENTIDVNNIIGGTGCKRLRNRGGQESRAARILRLGRRAVWESDEDIELDQNRNQKMIKKRTRILNQRSNYSKGRTTSLNQTTDSMHRIENQELTGKMVSRNGKPRTTVDLDRQEIAHDRLGSIDFDLSFEDPLSNSDDPVDQDPSKLFQEYVQGRSREQMEREKRRRRQREQQEAFREKMKRSQESQGFDVPTDLPSTTCSSLSKQHPVNPVILINSKELLSSASMVSTLAIKHGMDPRVCQLRGCDFMVSTRMGVERKTLSVIRINYKELLSSASIVSTLAIKHGMDPRVCQLRGCDFMVSTRMGVERKTLSDFSSSSNKTKLVECVKEMGLLFDKLCIIIEKDRIKRDEKPKPFIRSKYFDGVLAALMKTPIKVLFSDSADDTSMILADLARLEARKGFSILYPKELTETEEQTHSFCQSIPGVNFALALTMTLRFPSLSQLITCEEKMLQDHTGITEERARCIVGHLKHRFDEQMMGTPKRK